MDDQVVGIAQQGLGRAQDAVGGLTGDLKAQAKGKINEAAGAAREAIGAIKADVTDQIGERVDQVRSGLHDQLDALEARVIEKPLPALAVAGAVGLALGLLLFGRSKTVYVRDRH